MEIRKSTSAGSKLCMIIASMFCARLPVVTDRVSCISTPGKDIDVLVHKAALLSTPSNLSCGKGSWMPVCR